MSCWTPLFSLPTSAANGTAPPVYGRGRRRGITCDELDQRFRISSGVLRAQPGKSRDRRQAMFEFLINTIEVLPYGLEQAITHAQLNTDLSRAGIVVGPHDLMIAATTGTWPLSTRKNSPAFRVSASHPSKTFASKSPDLHPAKGEPSTRMTQS